MATTRLPMRHLREILRQKHELKRSHRAVARSLGVSSGAVAAAMSRSRKVGLDWSQIQALSDEALEEKLYGPRGGKRQGRAPLPDPAHLHVELRRPGVTLQLLHLEYLEQHPNGYRYTAFCAHYSGGWASAARRCARCITAATSSSWTTQATSRTSSIRRRAR